MIQANADNSKQVEAMKALLLQAEEVGKWYLYLEGAMMLEEGADDIYKAMKETRAIYETLREKKAELYNLFAPIAEALAVEENTELKETFAVSFMRDAQQTIATGFVLSSLIGNTRFRAPDESDLSYAEELAAQYTEEYILAESDPLNETPSSCME